MATQVLTDVKTYLDGFDLSGDLNSVALQHGAEMLDDTVFGDDTRSRKGGLETFSFTLEGFWSGGTDNVDEVLFTRIGGEGKVLTMVPGTAAEGDTGYFTKLLAGEYAPSGEVGAMFAFSVDGEGAGGDPLVRGTVLQAAGTETSSANSSGQQLGTVGSDETLWAALHVYDDPGGTSPTLDVTIESDDASGFASPTTQLTFAQATARTAEIVSTAGAISDDWFRAAFTIGGTSPSFDFIVTVGIK